MVVAGDLVQVTGQSEVTVVAWVSESPQGDWVFIGPDDRQVGYPASSVEIVG